MSIGAGLVGLPNVGKSTLFNALTKSSIPAENYPFCTIDPHSACTMVNDERLTHLASLFQSQKTIPATVQFIDIAGLVKGAASGEGLGNQFLGHIRTVDLIIHVLRCFEDSNVIHTSHAVDPITDYETIVTELILKDEESLLRRTEKIAQLMKSSKHQNPQQHKQLEQELILIKDLEKDLNTGDVQSIRRRIAQAPTETVPLLSAKKFLVAANLSESEIGNDAYKNNKYYQALLEKFGSDIVIPICAKLESELAQLPEEDASALAHEMGLKHKGLDIIIEKTYRNLGLITFFTCGPKEAHAWPISKGLTVRQAAGKIHSDLERGFICAEVYNCEDLFKLGSIAALRDAGKIRTEGQNYIVQDGDLLNIKFNV